MTVAFVLGNGVSRVGLPLTHIQKLGKIYGCNALYREFSPNVLVATDQQISFAIQESGYSNNHIFYTRKPIIGYGAYYIPKQYYEFSSGATATGIAALAQHIKIYLLGFDIGADTNNEFNNIYAGTEFYKPVGSAPTYTNNWVKQLITIIADFPSTQFIRVCGKTTLPLQELTNIKNLSHEDLTTFVMRINNQKDL